MSDKTASTTINFATQQGALPLSLSLSLDEEHIESYYGAAQTEFETNQPAFLKLSGLARARSGQADPAYELVTTAGIIETSGTLLVETVTETVVFANSAAEQLAGFPVGSVDCQWLGRGPGSARVDPDTRTVTLSSPGTGLLECTYQTYYDRLKLSAVTTPDGADADGFDVLVVAIQGAADASRQVAYVEAAAAGAAATRDVELEVVDICTGEAIEAAQVYLDEALMGRTDADGLLTFSQLTVGQQYQLKITATEAAGASGDYVATDEDVLTNDWFTVPAESETE